MQPRALFLFVFLQPHIPPNQVVGHVVVVSPLSTTLPFFPHDTPPQLHDTPSPPTTTATITITRTRWIPGLVIGGDGPALSS